MRIRKHAKISPLHYYTSSLFLQQHGAVLQTHLCQLNQSPWDAMTFPIEDVENDNIINHQALLPPPPPAPSSSSSYKLDGYDSCAVNGTFYDSEQSSITTMKLETNDSEMNYFDNNIVSNVPADSGDFEKNEQNDNITTMCVKNDGKGWQCSRESKRGHNLCEHHFAQKHYSSSSNNSAHSTTITAAAANSDTKINVTTAAAAAETTHSSRGRPHRPKKSSSSEFYYYSGFGPLWGKKRGLTTDKSTQSSSSQIDNEGFDYIEDDEDDNDDDEVENCKMKIKRARKPIKARSLKSLM